MIHEPVISFLGAAGTVTGSRFLIESADSRVLVDAGLFQGLKRHRLANWAPFPVDPSSIDAIIISHAHIDHSGYIPVLVKRGFAGPIFSTHRTAQLCEILLRDAAHLQEEEARYANRKGYSKHHPALALFTPADAEAALELFQPVDFAERTRVTGDVTFLLQPAGHILGSASVAVDVAVDDGAPPRRIVFSGDLGRGDHPVLGSPAAPEPADVMLIESTYGDRSHPDAVRDTEALVAGIQAAASRGGMVLIPAFSVDRTEVVLMLLRDLMDDGRIPQLPIYADSPMAIKVLEIYRNAVQAGDLDVRREDLAPTLGDLEVNECRTPDESKALADLTYPSIIISASGMATGGRVLHHLARLLPDDRNVVVMAGFQAAGTRGRDLVDGARTLKMLGRHVPVRAEVIAMESLSVHADAEDLLAWVGAAPHPPGIVYVVHGEPRASEALCSRLQDELDLVAVCPSEGERVLVPASVRRE